MSYYKIKQILHSGRKGARYTPRTDGKYPLRINRIVKFDENDIKIGECLLWDYIKDENGNYYKGYQFRTSFVKDWDYEYEDVISVETNNSIYVFEKVNEYEEKIKLIFQNSYGSERVIAEPLNKEECFQEINKFLDEHHFKSYYTRAWEEDGRIKLDVGSYTEFFFIDGMTFEEFTK